MISVFEELADSHRDALLRLGDEHYREEKSMDARKFNNWYKGLEAGYREFAESFSKQEGELRQKCRRKRLAGATVEEVQRAYIEGYEKIIEAQEFDFNKGAGAKYLDAVERATKTLYGPGGPAYASHLIALSSTPDDRLSELAALAEQARDGDLSRAIAHTAEKRGRRVLFEAWVGSQQDTHNAARFLDTTPSKEQPITRMLTAMRPPKSPPESLEPGPEERRQYAEQKRAEAKPVREFFGSTASGKRQAGRRMS